MQRYDKDEIKNSLSIAQVEELVSELGGEPQETNGGFIAKTICHCGEAHKLQYYDNTKLFHCWTECGDSFDIHSLVQRVKSKENENFTFVDAVKYVAHYFGFLAEDETEGDGFQKKLKDWEIFDRFDAITNIDEEKRIVELKHYDKKILQYLPTPRILPWIEEHISITAMQDANIKYDPVNDAIIIPHYDIDNNLIGIRQRTLIKEREKYGKYMPAVLNNKMYNHPLSFSLYNLNLSKDNIKIAKRAIVFESEKSCLLYRTYFGADNDISVACCGSNLIRYQFNLLKSLGISEVIIAFDKQFQEIGDKEYKQWTKKLTEIDKKYSSEALISFIFDKTGDRLNYKASPIDQGKELFLQLFSERIYL